MRASIVLTIDDSATTARSARRSATHRWSSCCLSEATFSNWLVTIPSINWSAVRAENSPTMAKGTRETKKTPTASLNCKL